MDFTDLPMAFATMLAENQDVLNIYSCLPQKKKEAVVQRARKAKTTEDYHAILDALSQGNI